MSFLMQELWSNVKKTVFKLSVSIQLYLKTNK
ncbi:hypothetical protein VCRA2110O319_230005 [Vibrio crassostreae]|nr:hypothetical protein VCRA2110O319_230005 [Vibrio crassostreae]